MGESNNFHTKKSDTVSNHRGSRRAQFIAYIGILFGVFFILSQLFFAGFRTHAGDVVVFTTVSAGSLQILNASTSHSFGSGITVSFTRQTNTLDQLGGIQVEDARGSGAGWGLDLTAVDWKGGTKDMQLDVDETGLDDNLGKMCLIVAAGDILSVAGQDTSSINKGPLACYSASVSTLNLYTAESNFGKGQYWIKEFDLEQFIPANPTAQSLTTTITYTLS